MPMVLTLIPPTPDEDVPAGGLVSIEDMAWVGEGAVDPGCDEGADADEAEEADDEVEDEEAAEDEENAEVEDDSDD